MQSKLYSAFGICHRIERMIARKLRTIVMDDPSRNTESMNDMVFDEVNYANSFNLCKWYTYRPL